MRQAHPIPDVDAFGGLRAKRALDVSGSLIGAHERDNQIQLRAGIDHPADTAQNAIHLSERSKPIDVNRDEACSLQQKLFVAHETPQQLALGNSATCLARLSSLLHSTVKIVIGCSILHTSTGLTYKFQFVPTPHEYAPAVEEVAL